MAQKASGLIRVRLSPRGRILWIAAPIKMRNVVAALLLALAGCQAAVPVRPVSGPFPPTAFDRWLMARFWEDHPEALCDPEPQLDDGALWRCPEGTPPEHFRRVP